MINLEKLSSEQFKSMKDIVSKAIEKSELERYFLFTNDPIEKGRVFLFCNRFLKTIYNLIDDTELRNQIKNTLDENKHLEQSILKSIEILNSNINLGKHFYYEKLLNLVNNNKVNKIIDLFAVLTEKVSTLKISKLKGIVLEGRSGEEYKKVFKEFREI